MLPIEKRPRINIDFSYFPEAIEQPPKTSFKNIKLQQIPILKDKEGNEYCEIRVEDFYDGDVELHSKDFQSKK